MKIQFIRRRENIMLNFMYENKTKIIFGKDTELQSAREAKAYGNRVLVHYGGGSIKNNGLYEKIVKCLKEDNLEFIELREFNLILDYD